MSSSPVVTRALLVELISRGRLKVFSLAGLQQGELGQQRIGATIIHWLPFFCSVIACSSKGQTLDRFFPPWTSYFALSVTLLVSS